MDNEDIQLTDTTTAADVEEWDSITHIQLIVAVEKFFKIKFNAAEIRTFKNVGELTGTIKSKLAWFMKLHHIGAIVDSIDDACKSYGLLHNKIFEANKIFMASQQVNVCFISIANDTLLELIEKAGENSAISRMQAKGFTFYHLGYKVQDFEKSLAELGEKNFKHLNTFYSEAFENKKCAFLFSPEMHLIEIIEE